MNNKILEKCPFCEESVDAPFSGLAASHGYQVNCPRCGKYVIDTDAYTKLSNSSLTCRQGANISGYLRENKGFIINSSEIVDNLLKIKTPSFHERADKLLLALEGKTEYAGHVLMGNKTWRTLGWCLNNDELNEILLFLKETGRIISESDLREPIPEVKIVAEGWKHLEQLKKVNADSLQGFVAMSFKIEMMPVQEAILQGIRDAGYKPHILNNSDYNGKIDDEIISQIRRSRFVLADFTGHRPNVYYEAGFAQGLGIEVFWTCREEEIEGTHFDVRQYNCIGWTDKTENDLKEFKRRITSRIEASIGRGSYQQQE